jgi:hypothetical protein
VERVTLSGAGDLRQRWLQKAQQLDQNGRFARYPFQKRQEILRKGFLGKLPPDRALELAKDQVRRGIAVRTARFNDQVRDCFGMVGEEVRETLLRLLKEVPPDSYEPPARLEEPPGYPFVFQSKVLNSDVYLKFQVMGTEKKPSVLFWSCHPPR